MMQADLAPAGKRVAVVGAGIAGLTAAFRLQQAGADVLVLEREARVGGRMSTIDIDGFVVDIGASILSYAYREMLELIDDAGLTGAIEPSGGPVGIVRDGRVHRFGTQSELRELCAGTLLGDRADTAFHETVGKGPEYGDLFYLSQVVGKGFFSSPAGVGFLPEELARLVPVQTCATVRCIESRPDGVTVTWERQDGGSKTEHFDAGIVAAPAPHVANLCPGLAPQLRELFAAITYARSIEVFVGLERPPDEPAMWVTMGRRDPDLASVIMDHHKAPSHVPAGRGLVSSFWHPKWCARRWDDDDHTVAADALRKLDAIYPGLSDTVLFTRVQRWDPCIVAPPGGFHIVDQLTRSLDPDSRLHFAGDYFAISTTNGSLCSGARAARRVGSQLSLDGIIHQGFSENHR
jgi:protoporphyrinogen/coproporphyrinogen III oxidase